MAFPYITAHSGCEGTPQDQLDTVDIALELGAEIIEMDIRRAQDHVLRISHDALDPEGYAQKPTLEEVFAKIRDTDLKINCDIKEEATLWDIFVLAEKYGIGKDRLIFSGCTSPEQLARDPRICEQATVLLNLEELLKFFYMSEGLPGWDLDFIRLMQSPWSFIRTIPEPEGYLHWHLDKIVEFIKLLKVAGLNLPYWCMTDQLAEACRENGIFFSVWTVNDPDKIERCIRLGAGNITTRAVRAALDTRDRMLSLPAERS